MAPQIYGVILTGYIFFTIGNLSAIGVGIYNEKDRIASALRFSYGFLRKRIAGGSRESGLEDEESDRNLSQPLLSGDELINDEEDDDGKPLRKNSTHL